MKTSDVYKALVQELESFRQFPVSDLVVMVGTTTILRTIEISGEQIELELTVLWHDKEHRSVHIAGHARGPSTWHHEHLQESITIPVSSTM